MHNIYFEVFVRDCRTILWIHMWWWWSLHVSSSFSSSLFFSHHMSVDLSSFAVKSIRSWLEYNVTKVSISSFMNLKPFKTFKTQLSSLMCFCWIKLLNLIWCLRFYSIFLKFLFVNQNINFMVIKERDISESNQVKISEGHKVYNVWCMCLCRNRKWLAKCPTL